MARQLRAMAALMPLVAPSLRLADVLERCVAWLSVAGRTFHWRHSLSSPQPLGTHLRELPRAQRNDFLRCVLWLLRRGLLVQLHTYVFLVVPAPAPGVSRSVVVDDQTPTAVLLCVAAADIGER